MKVSQEQRETGKQWIEGVLRALADADWVRITSIEWAHGDDGLHQLVVMTPHKPLTETFRDADLERVLDDDRIRGEMKTRLAMLIAGGYQDERPKG